MSKIISSLIAFILEILIIGILMTFPVMFLWNWLMPELFGLTTISAVQALGLSLLSSCLLGVKFGGNGG